MGGMVMQIPYNYSVHTMHNILHVIEGHLLRTYMSPIMYINEINN